VCGRAQARSAFLACSCAHRRIVRRCRLPTDSANPRRARAAARSNRHDRDSASAPAGSVGVQVGAYSNRAQAEAGWTQLAGRFEALQGRNHRVLEGTADSGTIYRLQAVAGSAAEADTLCRSIKAAGGDCQVKR